MLAQPYTGGISANIGFCKRYLVPSGTIGMCLLDPLLVDFPPIKGCNEVYADKKQPQKGEFPLSTAAVGNYAAYSFRCAPLFTFSR